MFHLELRQFPHMASRFNLSEGELRVVAEPWVREQMVELGERRWDPRKATLTILEGPELSLQQLSMGRGWRTAQRESEDVTARFLGYVRASAAAPAAGTGGASQSATPLATPVGAPSDPLALGIQMAGLLGKEPLALLDAWRAAADSAPGVKPSEALAIAEEEVARRAT
jgi:hypothetical protein